MSNTDGDAQKFDDLNMPPEELAGMPADGMPDPTAKSPPADDAEAVAAEDEGIVADSKTPPKDNTAKSLGPKSDGLLSSVVRMSPYTVMLAISVLAIGVALLCLILEWDNYGFNREPPKNLSMSRTVEAVPMFATIDDRCDCVARRPVGFDQCFDPWRCG